MDQVTAEQHFVPQFYLRKFTNAKNVVEILDCKQKKILTPRGTKGICYKDFFYGAKTGESDEISQQIETMFRQMENWITKDIDRIISKIQNNEQILDNEKWLIAFLMSMLWIRGPVIRGQINAMSEQLMKKINRLHFGHPEIDEWFDQVDKKRGEITPQAQREGVKEMAAKGEYSLEFDNYFHLTMFDSFRGFANLFFWQHWTVFISRFSKFVTSDNPIAVYLPEKKGFYGPAFPERIHHFALSPEIFIVARYPVTSGKKFKRKTLFAENERQILHLNLSICNRAKQFVYATERQSIEEILAQAS